MILLTHQTPILLGVAPADFRKGIDGFVALCTATLGSAPRDGTVLVFTNRARTMLRALSYDGNGYWLMTKRLSQGRFSGWPTGDQPMTPASARQLRQLISGAAEPWQWQAAVASAPLCTTLRTFPGPMPAAQRPSP